MQRAIVKEVLARLTKPPDLMQIVVGPRQVGKTTTAHQIGKEWMGPVRYASADSPLPPGPEWIQPRWEFARRDVSRGKRVLLVLDEVQKAAGWSEVVEANWDADRASRASIRVLLLGSSALLLTRGANESMAGSFFLHRCLHWSFPECRKAFGWDLNRWIYFGGYPVAAPLADDDGRSGPTSATLWSSWRSRGTCWRWKRSRSPHCCGSSSPRAACTPHGCCPTRRCSASCKTRRTRQRSPTISASSRRPFSPQASRFNAGRTARRRSSLKLVVWNNALVTGLGLTGFEEAREVSSLCGRLVENAVGAHLLNRLQGGPLIVGTGRMRLAEFFSTKPMECSYDE